MPDNDVYEALNLNCEIHDPLIRCLGNRAGQIWPCREHVLNHTKYITLLLYVFERKKKTILWCPWNSIHNLWTYLPLGKGFRPWKCIKSLKSSSLTDWMVMMSMKPSSKIKNHNPWVMGTGPWAGCDTQVIVNACWPLATLKTIAQVLGYNFRSRRHQSTHLKS